MTRRMLSAPPITRSGLGGAAVAILLCLATMRRPELDWEHGVGSAWAPEFAPGGQDGQEDSELVQEAVRRAQGGDLEGMHFLYARFAPDVQDDLASLGHGHHEAEVITQAVFAHLPTSIRRYRPREAPFAVWILRVARNSLR